MQLKKKNIFSKIIRDSSGLILIAPAIICLYLFTIRPQVLGMVWSFFRMHGYNIKEFVGLENFQRIFKDTAFWQAMRNTFVYVFWSLVLGYGLPIILALLLNEVVHLRKTFRLMIYFPVIIPAASTALLWYFIYYPNASGLLNIILGYIGIDPYVWLQDGRYTILYLIICSSWHGCGSTALYYFAALQGVNRELYEAALMDGAGVFKRITTITLPSISGIALLFLVKQIIGVFSILELPLQMTGGGPNGASSTLGLMSYEYGFVYLKPDLAMTISVVMFIILFIFTLFYFKLNKKIESNY